MNFSEFIKKPIAKQNHKLEETIEVVEEKEMPLSSCTNFGLHPGANLFTEQRKSIIDCTKIEMALLKKTYPADSLVMPKRRGQRPKN